MDKVKTYDQVKVMACHCLHLVQGGEHSTSQDTIYGLGLRLHNYARHGHNKGAGWRCTVCGTTKAA